MSITYVIGSGPSLNYVNPAMFENSVVWAVNGAAERVGLYGQGPGKPTEVNTFSHYHEHITRLYREYQTGVCTHQRTRWFTVEHDRGFADGPEFAGPYGITVLQHAGQDFEYDPWTQDIPESGVLMGSTSLHGAMWMAAKDQPDAIILVGADTYSIDDQWGHHGYVPGNFATLTPPAQTSWGYRWEVHLEETAKIIRSTFGVHVHSLNPFVTLRAEGHRLDRHPDIVV